MPRTREFHPAGGSPRKEAVVLTVDEYEAVRLIDRQGFSQEECSAYMQVARSTVQSIYNSARKKLAEALVDGRSLRIEGGNYQLCDGSEVYCGCGGCRRHRLACMGRTEQGGCDHKNCGPIGLKRTGRVLARAPCILFWEDEKDMVLENPAAQARAVAG